MGPTLKLKKLIIGIRGIWRWKNKRAYL